MTGTLLLALTLAQAAPADPPSSIEVAVFATFPDGQRRQIASLGRAHRTVHLYRDGTMCEAATISTAEPASDAFGWTIGLVRAGSDTRIMWSRLNGAAAWFGKKNSVQTLPHVPADAGWFVHDRLANPAGAGSCKALSWTLEVRRAVAARAESLIEAELWFVHKAPDGKETSQLQTLRIKADGSGEFYFDDLEIQTRWLEQDIKLTVEVFGGLLTSAPRDGKFALMLNLTRRYMTKQFLMGAWPKTGSANMPMTVAAGEVVSIVLPPLQDDSGVFLGHRFSLRMRLKPLAPDQN